MGRLRRPRGNIFEGHEYAAFGDAGIAGAVRRGAESFGPGGAAGAGDFRRAAGLARVRGAAAGFAAERGAFARYRVVADAGWEGASQVVGAADSRAQMEGAGGGR